MDNIKEKSLKEVLESPFFKGIRERQPYTENLLRPCMIKDHPHVLRELVEEFKPRPSYPGADDIIKNPRVMKDLDEYAKELQEVMDPVWDKEFGSDWKCWT